MLFVCEDASLVYKALYRNRSIAPYILYRDGYLEGCGPDDEDPFGSTFYNSVMFEAPRVPRYNAAPLGEEWYDYPELVIDIDNNTESPIRISEQ